MTIHKVQGLTLDSIVVDMSHGGRFLPGQIYVAFSRVKTLEGLYILNFNKKAFKTNNKVNKEMCRLRENFLIIPQDMDFTTPIKCITIGLLNVHSLVHKIKHIQQDKIYNTCNIACLTETWLNINTTFTGLSTERRYIRNDRTQDNTVGGGVLIDVKAFISIITTKSFNADGTEVLMAQLRFYDYEVLTMILVYRSPSSNKQHLISILQEIFTEININTPGITIVLGDFNENILLESTDRTIYRYLQLCHFKQFVSDPTTDTGSLLDCVYIHQPTDTPKIYTTDCYYSDHDWVVIQMQNFVLT